MAKRKRHNFPEPKRSTSARGYGSPHKAERGRWEPVVESGRVACVRCGFPIVPGTRWHLDHADDKLHYRGPAHASCNLRAAAKARERAPARQAGSESAAELGARGVEGVEGMVSIVGCSSVTALVFGEAEQKDVNGH